MKFIVFVALCLSICAISTGKNATETNWGNVYGRVITSNNIVVTSSFMQIKTHKLNYSSPLPVWGIKHLDYKSHPVKVNFVKGSLGERVWNIIIESQRNHGINSTFVFYN